MFIDYNKGYCLIQTLYSWFTNFKGEFFIKFKMVETKNLLLFDEGQKIIETFLGYFLHAE